MVCPIRVASSSTNAAQTHAACQRRTVPRLDTAHVHSGGGGDLHHVPVLRAGLGSDI